MRLRSTRAGAGGKDAPVLLALPEPRLPNNRCGLPLLPFVSRRECKCAAGDPGSPTTDDPRLSPPPPPPGCASDGEAIHQDVITAAITGVKIRFPEDATAVQAAKSTPTPATTEVVVT